MTIQELRELALHAARGTAPEKFSMEAVEAAFSDGFKEFFGSPNLFRKNQHDLFEIIIRAVDEIVPARVIGAMQIFAETQVVGDGQKVFFKTGQRLGRDRARKFLTQVGINGVYETFRLDSSTFEVKVHAVGTGISLDFDRMTIGAETMSDLMDVVTEGLVDAVYVEVQRALRAAVTDKAPTANRVVTNNFDSNKMFSLVGTVRAYGGSSMGSSAGAVIFAPPEFVGAMGADAIVPVGTNYPGIYHPQDVDMIHNYGYINLFRGTPIVQIPQSYTDTSNTTTWIDPQLAYVLPTGGERVVKIVFEGATDMWSGEDRDRAFEVYFSKKFGVAIETLYDWGIYQNTSIPQTMYDPYPNI